MSQPIKIICWKWTDKRWPNAYTAHNVNVLYDSIRRNLKIPFQFFCITDDFEGINENVGIIPLWDDFKEMGWCLTRLKAFSEEMINPIGERFFSIDLDTVISGDLTELLTSQPDFVIAKDTQANNCYNGSFWGMDSGCRKAVFHNFKANPKAHLSACVALGMNADDQAVMAVIMGKNEKTLGAADGLYSYKNEIIKAPHFGKLPENAKMVFFHGNPKQWDFPPPPIIKPAWIDEHYRLNKKGLLVLGGASCVWDDLEGIDKTKFDIMAVNDMGWAYQNRIDYWVTLHPENFPAWKAKRKGNKDYESWSYTKIPVAGLNGILEDFWRAKNGISGSSGLFAAQVGLHLGYDHVLLAGVPMDGTNNQTGPKACWNDKTAVSFRTAWEENKSKLLGKVFSCSGWTKDLLGYERFEL